jgi:hypothetical protein
MGNFFASENTKNAIEKLEDLVWDDDNPIDIDKIRSVLTDCHIVNFTSLQEIIHSMDTKITSHNRMKNAFLKNNSPHMYHHHHKLSSRYQEIKNGCYKGFIQ